MLTIEEIKDIIFELGHRIGLCNDSVLYPMFSNTSQAFSEGASIYIAESNYHFVMMEKGQVIKRVDSEEAGPVLYEIFRNITGSLAQEFELEHREKNSDSRRVWWTKQLELLNRINPDFAIKRKKEMVKILKISPFRDN